MLTRRRQSPCSGAVGSFALPQDPVVAGQAAEWKILAEDVRRVRGVVDRAIEHVAAGGLTGYLSGLYTDRIERSAKGDECEIKLLFHL